jgi:hypothetical protein
LNTDATFIKDMADMAVQALRDPSSSVTEACIANNCGWIEQDFDPRVELLVSKKSEPNKTFEQSLVSKIKSESTDVEQPNSPLIFGAQFES